MPRISVLLTGMTTPPRVHPQAVDAAADSIFRRHTDRGDQAADEMGHLPRDVLAYLRRRAPQLPDGLRVDDLDDVAVLLLGNWWDEQRELLFWLRQVVKLGAARKEFAGTFGITSKQGFRDWLDRLEALLSETGPGRPDEQSQRADRRSLAEEANRPATSEQKWLADHVGEYAKLATDLLGFYMLVDDYTAEAIAEVRRDLAEGDYEPDRIVVLGLAMESLEGCSVNVRKRRLEDGETHTAEEVASYEQFDVKTRERIGQAVKRWTDLQQQRRDAAAF